MTVACVINMPFSTAFQAESNSLAFSIQTLFFLLIMTSIHNVLTPYSAMLAIILLPLLFFAAGFFLYLSPRCSNLPILGRLSTVIQPDRHRRTATAQKVGTTVGEPELKMVFATFDQNSDGFISKQELHQLLYSLGLSDADQEQAATMIENFDSNRDGHIDTQEFCSLYESIMKRDEEVVIEDVQEAFEVFDKDGDGLITVKELGLVLSSLGMKNGVDDCRRMINKVDMDGDGKINLAEFMLMMQVSKPPVS